MEVIFGPLLFIGFFAVILGISLFSRQRRRDNWRAFANQYGGSFIESQAWFSSTDDYVSLTLDGFGVVLDHYVVSHGKSSTTYQRATIHTTGYTGFTAQIYQETPIFSKIGKAFGGQDIVVGHDAFDEAFIIKSDSPERLVNSLDRAAMVEHLRQRHMRVELNGHTLTVVRVGLILNHDAMFAQLRLATLYARGFFGPAKHLAPPHEPTQHEAPPNAAW